MATLKPREIRALRRLLADRQRAALVSRGALDVCALSAGSTQRFFDDHAISIADCIAKYRR